MSLPLANADQSGPNRLKLDLLTSYALAAARVGANIAIFAILYRYTSERYAATFALIRSVLMLLTYLFGGFNPALQRLLAAPFAAERTPAPSNSAPKVGTLAYEPPRHRRHDPPTESSILYANTSLLVGALFLLAVAGVMFYSASVRSLHDLSIMRWWVAEQFAFWFGLGMLARLVTEPASAVIQSRGCLWLDNLFLIVGEVAWVALTAVTLGSNHEANFKSIAGWYFVSGLAVFLLRVGAARFLLGFDIRPLFIVRTRTLTWLIATTSLVSIGQFADFLYAPANVLLINTLIHPSSVARYAPALQIDAGLLLLVGAVSTVMLPRAMSAWARGERELLRSAYLRASLACLLVLSGAALFVGTFVEPILRLWLGVVPYDTPTLTRLVLIHTVIGGTAGVGRAVLLGMGRFRAYTVSALLGGIANVGLAILFVLVFGWGVRGIVFATVISVTVRCAIWMPWYILRGLRPVATASATE